MKSYLVAFDIPEIRNILPDSGSYVDLRGGHLAASNCVPPPQYAALGEATFSAEGMAYACFLKMRFEEPKRLVERAGIGGEDVRGVRVAGFVGLVDRLAHQILAAVP